MSVFEIHEFLRKISWQNLTLVLNYTCFAPYFWAYIRVIRRNARHIRVYTLDLEVYTSDFRSTFGTIDVFPTFRHEACFLVRFEANLT